MNVTVNGVAQNEDVDYFEVNVTEGQRISAEVEAIRLSGPLFDPYVAILDENRFEIATSDDSELLLQDSTTNVIVQRLANIMRSENLPTGVIVHTDTACIGFSNPLLTPAEERLAKQLNSLF